MDENKIKELLGYKKECLFEEYQALTSSIEVNADVSMRIKNWAITIWLLGLGLAFEVNLDPVVGASAMALAIGSFWFLNVFYSFYSAHERQRLREVSAMLNRLHSVQAEEAIAWETPKDPYQGLTARDKIRTLRRSALSPAIATVYLFLIFIEIVIFALFA